MTSQLTKNHRTILLIFALGMIPFLIAWYLAKHPQLVRLGTNNGDLINPPLTTQLVELTAYDQPSADNIKELQGHWVMINFLPDGHCSEVCADALHKTRQISLMMGKDLTRIRRLALLEISRPDAFPKDWQLDDRLLKMLPSAELQRKLQAIAPKGLEGVLMIMDPLGNVMMQYPAGVDPYQVRNDLSKLLRISQIG